MADREDSEISVREAARSLQRHPETIRRWVWTGRVAARRAGNRLLLDRAELEAIAASDAARGANGLKAWADRAAQLRATGGELVRSASAADLVFDDRQQRSSAETSDGS